jgi:hypothetical protein
MELGHCLFSYGFFVPAIYPLILQGRETPTGYPATAPYEPYKLKCRESLSTSLFSDFLAQIAGRGY